MYDQIKSVEHIANPLHCSAVRCLCSRILLIALLTDLSLLMFSLVFLHTSSSSRILLKLLPFHHIVSALWHRCVCLSYSC